MNCLPDRVADGAARPQTADTERTKTADTERTTSAAEHEPASDIDAVVVDSLKALDPERPIREADIATFEWNGRAFALLRTLIVSMLG
jgi:hypothetical protein